MKKISIVLIVLTSLATLLFSSFGRSTELSDLDSVSGVAIDKSQGKWRVYCEITVPSKDEPYGSKNIGVKGEGLTLSEALENTKKECKREWYTDSVQLFVISDSLKENSELTDRFLNENVNMRAVAVYCNGPAYKLLQTETDSENESIFISNKIKRYCFENKIPVPKVTSLLQDSAEVFLTEKGIPERSAAVDK